MKTDEKHRIAKIVCLCPEIQNTCLAKTAGSSFNAKIFLDQSAHEA